MKIHQLSKKIIIPGFKGLSIHQVSMFFYKGLIEGAITTRASSLAFNFFLAFFPSILVLFTLIPFVPIEGFQEQLFILIMDILPPSTYEATKSTVDNIINHEQGGLLSLTFILALYFSTNGINAMISGFNSTYHHTDTRSWYQLRILSLTLTILLALLLILTITFLLFSKEFMDNLVSIGYLEQYSANIILYAKWFALIIVLFLSISLIYYYGPDYKSRVNFISPGSISATLLSIITSIGFNYYISNFGQYNQLYGSIGTLLIILLWMYFNSIILLLGFELNASIVSAKQTKIKNHYK